MAIASSRCSRICSRTRSSSLRRRGRSISWSSRRATSSGSRCAIGGLGSPKISARSSSPVSRSPTGRAGSRKAPVSVLPSAGRWFLPTGARSGWKASRARARRSSSPSRSNDPRPSISGMAFDEKRDTADLVAEDRELLEHNLAGANERLAKLSAAISAARQGGAGSKDALRGALHKLAGSAGTFGFAELGGPAPALEKRGEGADEPLAEDLLLEAVALRHETEQTFAEARSRMMPAE